MKYGIKHTECVEGYCGIIYSIERRTVWKWFSSQIIWRGDKVLLARVETAVYLLRNIIFYKWNLRKHCTYILVFVYIVPYIMWYCNYFIVLTVWIYLIRFLSIMIKVYWYGTYRNILIILEIINIMDECDSISTLTIELRECKDSSDGAVSLKRKPQLWSELDIQFIIGNK